MSLFSPLKCFAAGILETASETIMQRVSWMRRYAFLAYMVGLKFEGPKLQQVEGVLQEMRELSICGGN